MKDFSNDDFTDSSFEEYSDDGVEVGDDFLSESTEAIEEEITLDYDSLSRNYEKLDKDYNEAKASIEFSRSEEERDYWQRRADRLWIERDEEDLLLTQNKSDIVSSDTGYEDLLREFNELNKDYSEAKKSIEFSRSEEERDYWQRRADHLWKECDENDFNLNNH